MSKTAEETLADFRQKNAVRQTNFYNKHKDEINAKRRELYKAGKLAIKSTQPEKPVSPVVSSSLPIEKTKVGNSIVDLSTAKSLTKDDILATLDKVVLSESSRKTYKDSFKMFLRITGCEGDILACLKKPKVMISQIKNAKQRNGNPYAVNSLKVVFQIITFLITHLKLNLPKKTVDMYQKEFDLSKISSNDYTEEVANTKETISFSDYLKVVKEKLGENSKLYVISKFYKEFTLRDNFGLIVVDKLPAKQDGNYLVVKSTGMKISINQYKTVSRYGSFESPLSKDLTKLVRQYIKEFKVKMGDYLFGSEKLTAFITASNKSIGLSGGVNEYRHMAITEELSKLNVTPEKKLELATKMKHSPIVQLRYLRKNVVSML